MIQVECLVCRYVMMHNSKTVATDVSSLTIAPFKIKSFNCRGMNDTKKWYVRSLLSNCDILFLQEHWMTDDQLVMLDSLSLSHHSVGVCGFDCDSVLRGRPYGGCAILWRQGLFRDVTFVDCSSRRCVQ